MIALTAASCILLFSIRRLAISYYSWLYYVFDADLSLLNAGDAFSAYTYNSEMRFLS